MAAEFSSTPPIGAKVPPTVPLSDADPERQQLYAGLDEKLPEMEAQEDVNNTPQNNEPPPLSPPPDADLDAVYYEPTEEDKQAFVRALLGSKSFEKKFDLFGCMNCLYVDRTAEQTEQLYAQLNRDAKAGLFRIDTDGQWVTWLERYSLASTLREVRTSQGSNSHIPTDKLHERLKDLMKLPKPLYQALMQASRRFEAVVDTLTRKAHDPSFWKTGGASLPSKPISGAR